MDLAIRAATVADAQLLAEMNRQLADDERSRNSMTVAALAVRMEKWLQEGWRAVLFEKQPKVVGYSVFQIGTDYYDPAIPEVHVPTVLHSAGTSVSRIRAHRPRPAYEDGVSAWGTSSSGRFSDKSTR